jgi:myosin light chain 6
MFFFFVAGVKFAFDIYDFEGKSRFDAFYLGDFLRGLNTNPTLKAIDKFGGAKKKGEKFLTLDDACKIYGELKKSKDKGSFEDFIECLKLYDKHENGTMLLGELEHILLSLGMFNQLSFILCRKHIKLYQMMRTKNAKKNYRQQQTNKN